MDILPPGATRPPVVPDPDDPWTHTPPRTELRSDDVSVMAYENQVPNTNAGGASEEQSHVTTTATEMPEDVKSESSSSSECSGDPVHPWHEEFDGEPWELDSDYSSDGPEDTDAVDGGGGSATAPVTAEVDSGANEDADEDMPDIGDHQTPPIAAPSDSVAGLQMVVAYPVTPELTQCSRQLSRRRGAATAGRAFY